MTLEEFNQIVEDSHSETENNNIEISANTTSEINLKEYLIDNTSARFSSAEWADIIKQSEVTIAGLGGIGSWTALLISRLKPSFITVYDFDTVDSTNISGQFYNMEQIGRRKTDATCLNLANFSEYYTYNSKDTDINSLHNIDGNILVCGFDNMEARKKYFSLFKNKVQSTPIQHRKKILYVDGRLAAEEFQVFAITGNDEYHINKYEKEYLFNSKEAERTICSYKQTSYCACMIASIITNIVVNFITNLKQPILPRDTPFYTLYNAGLMYFKTSND